MATAEYWFLFAVDMAVVVLCVIALADAVRRPATAFVAHGKLTKPLWTGILLAAILVALMLGFVGSFIGPFAAVAGLVYLVDVKPAVSGSNNW
ncbi:MAG: hypothetical protein JWO22_2794 [Frankiales bacterium]|nr:hypothetical protein [Frankiales bacterium]